MEIIRRIEREFNPPFWDLADELREAYPQYRIGVSSNYYGSPDTYLEHKLAIECRFSEQPADQADNVLLFISLYRANTDPRIMAEVAWADGRTEARFRDWDSEIGWPRADDETISELAQSLESLAETFRSAIQRGRPPQNHVAA